MRCPKCGNEIANDSLFCEYCGTKVNLQKSKKALWIAFAIILSLCVIGGIIFVTNNKQTSPEDVLLQHAKELEQIYSINIPEDFHAAAFYSGPTIVYQDGKGGGIRVSGGNAWYASCNSLPDWFEYALKNESLVLDKSAFKERVIHQIPAMFAIGEIYSSSYQEAVLYSEKTGCYTIHIEYPKEKKDLYEGIMRSVVFSFKEK